MKGGFKGHPKGGKGDWTTQKGKGKGRPLNGSCFICGGPHFQRDCPQAGGGGKGGFRHLEGANWETEYAPALSRVVEVTPPVPTPEFEPARSRCRRNQKKAKMVLQCEEGCKDSQCHQADYDDTQLNVLKAIEPEGINSMDLHGEWEEIEMAVDSGATETVVGEDMLQSVELREGAASKRGVEYEVANGVKIPNLGEKKFRCVTEQGQERTITAQVCGVNKALLSVKRILSTKNRVVFDEAGSYIEDKFTGEKIWMREEGGMYMVKMGAPN